MTWPVPTRSMVLAGLLAIIVHRPFPGSPRWPYYVLDTATVAAAAGGVLARGHRVRDQWYACFVTLVLAVELWLGAALWPYGLLMMIGIGRELSSPQAAGGVYWPCLSVLHMMAVGVDVPFMWIAANLLALYFAVCSFDRLGCTAAPPAAPQAAPAAPLVPSAPPPSPSAPRGFAPFVGAQGVFNPFDNVQFEPAVVGLGSFIASSDESSSDSEDEPQHERREPIPAPGRLPLYSPSYPPLYPPKL